MSENLSALSCPVERRACLREVCTAFGQRTGWACMHIALELELRKDNQHQDRGTL